MLIIFNKKILFIFLLLFICNASSLFAMEIESTNDLPQSIIKNEDNETILKGFVYYLSQEFNYDKTYFDTINFDKSVENMLKFFS
ncbi:hypothetical protein K9L05_04005, partial [Candidatus Babeliales bacterium]|nr:hypothetical protein [Candidatus Babeliales bacterium]